MSSMSRTCLSAADLAKSLRRMAGDGSVEWCYEPMQASVLLDIADMLDENAKLRELVRKLYGGYMGVHYTISCNGCEHAYEDDGGYTPLDPDCCVFSFSDRYVGCWRQKRLEADMRELGVEVGQ